MLDVFNTQKDQQIDYFTLKTLLLDHLKVQGISNYMFSDFEYFLDDNETAYISLEFFDGYLKKYGFDMQFNTHIKKSKEVAKKEEYTPDSYVITEKDYFKGVKNIFNSSIAALAYCTQ